MLFFFYCSMTVLQCNSCVPLTRVSTCSSSAAFSSPRASPQVKAASRSRKTLVFIVNFWKRAAIQQLPCRVLLHSREKRERERSRDAQYCPSTPVSKMAQYQVMLMCYNTVAIRTSSPWTLSQHLGLPEEPASYIPPASHQAVCGWEAEAVYRGAGGRCCALLS